MRTESLQEQVVQYSKETLGGIRGRPIGCYTLLTLLGLLGLIGLHGSLILVFTVAGGLRFPSYFNLVFAALYAFAFSALSLCLILYLRLRFKRLGIAATLLLVALWIWSFFPLESQSTVLNLVPLFAAAPLVGFGLHRASGFLLPLTDRGDRGEVFKFLQDYVLHANRPALGVTHNSQIRGKIEELVPGDRLSRLAKGPGFVLTDCEHAVAVSDGLSFKGIRNPGVTFTGFGDQGMQSIDLCPQLRAPDVEALTKDGIKVKVPAFVPFRIDAGRRQVTLGEYLPFKRSAAFKAIYAQRIEHEEPESKRQRTWDELPPIIARRILQDIISRYNFDELYDSAHGNGTIPRQTIAKSFRHRLGTELKQIGIQLIGGGIGNLEPVDTCVYVERAHNWQSAWQRRIMLKQAESQTDWLRLVESARAEAQTDMILKLGRQLDNLSTSKSSPHPRKILDQLLKTLENLAAQPTLRRLLPMDTKRSMESIQKAIRDEGPI